MTDRRADDGTLHMADCPYTAGAGWCSECGRGDGERDCCCDALRACTVRVLGEVREAIDGLEHFTGADQQGQLYCWEEDPVRAIDRLAREAP